MGDMGALDHFELRYGTLRYYAAVSDGARNGGSVTGTLLRSMLSTREPSVAAKQTRLPFNAFSLVECSAVLEPDYCPALHVCKHYVQCCPTGPDLSMLLCVRVESGWAAVLA
jgi:hypothetical protein